MRLREAGNPRDESLVSETLRQARPFRTSADLDGLIRDLAKSQVVMLGESSHGTHEFYDWRRVISEQLILKHGFRFIAVEGDWPPSWKLNDFIQGSAGLDAREALRPFHRWPTWMWANRETMDLAEWMRSFNANAAPEERVNFYGLDIYSLFESIDAALEQLHSISPFLAKRMRARYECFDPYQRDEKAYARSLFKFPQGCRDEVAKNLKEALEQKADWTRSLTLFNTQQNARIVANAENYYRTMVHGNEDSWNIRDQHMMETLQTLLEHHGPQAKGIVWAHNTHIGDYRATDMEANGQINLGGLARKALGEKNVSLVGFGTFEGEVIASSAWDGPITRMPVPPGQPGSYEFAFHKAASALGCNHFFLRLKSRESQTGPFAEVRGHRAIGVVYHPDFEHLGNYVPTSLAHRYDAFLFFDKTRALDPLLQWFDRSEIPETWPQGM